MQQLINDLRSNSAIPFKNNEEKVIAEFTIKHMKGFAEWVEKNFIYSYIDGKTVYVGWEKEFLGKNYHSNQELIEKYFETIK